MGSPQADEEIGSDDEMAARVTSRGGMSQSHGRKLCKGESCHHLESPHGAASLRTADYGGRDKARASWRRQTLCGLSHAELRAPISHPAYREDSAADL